MTANLYAAWIGFLLGCVAGIIPGLFFHRPDWLGGYASWPRRMLRLGHISFFGIGLLNLAFDLLLRAVPAPSGAGPAGALLLTGAVTMPLVCYLAAWRAGWRHLFFIPALAITVGVALACWSLVKP